MEKRGQITFFIVLGIVILIVIGLLFFIRGLYKVPERERVVLSSVQKSPIESYVESCIIKTANEALDRIYLYGGYIDQDHYFREYGKLPLFTYSTEGLIYNIQPHSKEINYRISNYVKNNLLNCIDFTNFRNQGYFINEGSSVDNVKVEIQDDRIIFDVDYVVNMERSDIKVIYDSFKTFIPSKLGKVYGFMTDIVNEECMGYESALSENLEDMAIQEGIIINSFPVDISAGINRYELVSKNDGRNFNFACQKAGLVSLSFVENPGITEVGDTSNINLESGNYNMKIVGMTENSVELEFKKGNSIVKSVFLSTVGENNWPSIIELDLDNDKIKDLYVDLIYVDGKNAKFMFYKVVAVPPVAIAEVSPSMMNKNELENLVFDASKSYGVSADIIRYEWIIDYYRLDNSQVSKRKAVSFSDGEEKILAKSDYRLGNFGLSVSSVFNNGGTYVARLKVIDANGMEITGISNPFTIFNCDLNGEVKIISPLNGKSYSDLPTLKWEYVENGYSVGGVKYNVEFKLPDENEYRDYLGEIYSNTLDLNMIGGITNMDPDLVSLAGDYDPNTFGSNINVLQSRWNSFGDGAEIWFRVRARSFCGISDEDLTEWSESYFKKKVS